MRLRVVATCLPRALTSAACTGDSDWNRSADKRHSLANEERGATA